MKPLLILNVVGLTPRLVGEHTPRLRALTGDHPPLPLGGVLPAVTCTAQASILTGTMPNTHGIVANGWLYPDTREIRFWQQSRALIQAETLYDVARQRAAAQEEEFTCLKSFWWFNQGAAVDYSLTPKPWYGSDGNKIFGVHGHPASLVTEVQEHYGAFPFTSFWSPLAGLPSSEWIARASAHAILSRRPTLSLVYLPHLDYDLQRFGLSASQTPARLREVDACAGVVIDAAKEIGASVIVLSEYGLQDVNRPVHLNRVLREAGLLTVRSGPFGEMLDTFQSRALAVADHQLAHVYVRDASDIPRVRDLLAGTEGVARILGDEKSAAREAANFAPESKSTYALNHPRSGTLVALAERNAWFTYYYWLDDKLAPDFAPTVNIHAKPGYDPAELFFDPALCCPRIKVGWRLLQKKLGFRTRFDVTPLHAEMVRGSHGLLPADPADGAVFLTDTDAPQPQKIALTGIKDYALAALGLNAPAS